MPQPYDRGLVLDSLKRRMPELANYSDEDILKVYNRRQGLTPTGIPTLERKEQEAPPKYIHIRTPQHTGYGERFFKRFAEGLTPLGLYEPEMEDAEGFGESLIGALGSGFGFVLGALPFAVATGGVSVPMKSAQAVSRIGRIIERAKAAEKAGKKGYRTAKEIEDWVTGSLKVKTAKNLIPDKALIPGTGILGRTELYRRGMQSLAYSGRMKTAKALDMGVRNLATFSLYGQTHMKPNSPLEQRWEQLEADAVTSALFTGLGTLSTRVLFSNVTGKAKPAIVGGETFMMGLAGSFMADIGQEDIPYEERLAHGATLALMHLVGVGYDKITRKEKMVEHFMGRGYSIEQAQRMVYRNRLIDNADNLVIKFMKDSETLFIDNQYAARKKPSHLGKRAKPPELGDWLTHFVEFVKEPSDGSAPYVLIEHFKPKKRKGKEVKELDVEVYGETHQEKIIGKEVKDSMGNVIREPAQDAMMQFRKRFRLFRDAFPEEVPEIKLEKIPQGMTPESKLELAELDNQRKEIERFVSKPEKPIVRDVVYEDIPVVKTTGDIVPKVDVRLTEKEVIQRNIDALQKKIDNKNWVRKNADTYKLHLSGDFLFSNDTPWHLMTRKSILAKSEKDAQLRLRTHPDVFGDKWEAGMRKDNSKLAELKAKIKGADNKRKVHPVTEDFGIGDWVRIPLYLGEGRYSTSEAGLGRYEGKYDTLTGGKTPTYEKWEINTQGLDPRTDLSNVDVFATITPTGIERFERVAIRPTNVRPKLKPEQEPYILEQKYQENIRMRELDATKTDLPDISMLDVLANTYRFSLPKGLKKAEDLPKGANRANITIVNRLEKAGVTPDKFLKTLRSKGSMKVEDLTYHYAGEKKLQIPTENIKIEQTGDGRWKIVVDNGVLPLEYLREPEFRPLRKDVIDAMVSGDKFKRIGNTISAEIKHSPDLYHTKEIELPTGLFGKNTPVKLSKSQLGEAKIIDTSKTFKSRDDAVKYLNRYLKQKQPAYEEFYLQPEKAVDGSKPFRVEDRKKALGTAIEDLKEANAKGGEIYSAKSAKQNYDTGGVSGYESASIWNLKTSIPYNPQIIERLSDILNVNIGKPVRLRLTKLDRKGNKTSPKNDFKLGHMLDKKVDLNMGFDTHKQAENFAWKWWTGPDAEARLAGMLKDRKSIMENFGKSPKYIEYRNAQKKAARVLNAAKIPINVHGYKSSSLLKEVLDTFFPQANRDFTNLSTSELNRLSGMFRRNKDTDFIPEQVDILPPDNISFVGPVNQSMMKLVQQFNPALPVYTVMDTAGGWGKKLSTRAMVRSSIERSLKGLSQTFSSQFLKWRVGLKEKDMQTFQIELDPKFEKARVGTNHIKEIERLKNKMVTVSTPKFETKEVVNPKTKKKEKITEKKMITEKKSLYDYGIGLIRDFYDEFALAQARYNVEVYNTKTKKKKPYLEVITSREVIDKKTGKKEIVKNKINIDSIIPEHILQVLKKERVKGQKIKVLTDDGLKNYTIAEVTSNYYKPNFFHRALTQDFWNLVISEKANKYLLDKIIANDENLRNNYILDSEGKPKSATRKEVLEEAGKYLENLKEYSSNADKIIDGQIFARVADIEPYIYYGKDGILIEPVKLYKKDGSPFKVGDAVEKINGEKDVITKAVQTYSTDAVDIINKYASKASKSAATYGAYGVPDAIKKTPMGEAVQTGSKVVYEIERMKMDVMKASKNEIEGAKNAEFYENLIHRVLKDHIHGRDYNHPYLGEYLGPKLDWLIGRVTRGSAVAALSMPISGFKNFVLGQKELGIISGRELMRTWYHMLTDKSFRRKSYALADEVGAAYSGTYDLFIKPATPLGLLHSKHAGLKGIAGTGIGITKETLLRTGAMRPTEIFNRTVAAVMGTRMLDIHLDNMLGVKNWTTKGVPKSYSRSILEKVLRFTPKELDLMLKKRKSGGNPGYTDKQRLWAADRAHTVTQGVGDLPYIPYWMGNKGWKPFTLFYRIAYRMTDNIAKNVVQPAVHHGNIWPMMKYVGMSVGAGEALYSLYWYAFGEERKNKFKDAPAQYWSNFVRAEGLGVMSNAFDEHGDSVSDAYYPVILRNMTDLLNESLHIMRGEKTIKEGVDSGMKRVIALYGGSQRVIQNFTKDTRKKVKDSKRRQSQFLDVYFPNYNPSMDAGDYLTQNSPYYQSIRDAFWTDDVHLQGHTYHVALNYLTDVIMRDNVALAKNPIQAKKMAKARIKNIVSRLQPIPNAWKERKKGDRVTKYNLYMSKLTSEQRKEERELETLYKLKKAAFWHSVSHYTTGRH